ncbi:MAG: amidase [Hyphomonadaceae bacterium]
MRLTRRSLIATVWATGVAACATGPGVVAGGGAMDATETADLIRTGKMSAREAVEAAIKRAQAIQPKLNFLVNETFDAARAKALNPGNGPFAGVPYLVKDLNDQIGVQTRSGSRVTAGIAPATAEEVFVSRMLGTGLISIGKSAAPENGYLPTTEPLAFGPTRNPWDMTRSTAGSSGGSAAAVASGVVPIAHANDGGGSIRFPAANNGLVGLKPSRGRMVSETTPNQLDIAVEGCVSHTVRDTARFLSLMERTGDQAILPAVGMITDPLKRKLRVGILTKGFYGHEADPEVAAVVKNAARTMEGLGHTIIETEWPTAASFPDDFLAYWSLGAAQDVAAAAKKFNKPVDEASFEPFTLRMAENASKLNEGDISAVFNRLLGATQAYNNWIKDFDIVLTPMFASPPSPLGYLRGDVPFDTLRERLLQQVGYTLIHNVCGAPAISLPLGRTAANLPIGVQACAAKGAEGLLLEVAYLMEVALPWKGFRPGVYAT